MRPLLIALLTAFTCYLSAQFTYSGCVNGEDGNPLIGVSIVIKASETGTVTDIDGCFSLVVPGKGTELEFRYTGYETKLIKALAGKAVTIVLSPAAELLEEVVVVGYGRTMKREMSRAAPKVSADDAAYAPAPAAYGAEAPTRSTAPGKPSVPGSEIPFGQPAGQLTAGETNDFGKWEMWEDISQEDLAEFRDIWGFYPDHRYAVQLTYPGGRPATNIEVSLKNGTAVIWTARTDNRGRAELWSGMNDPQATVNYQLSLTAHHEGNAYPLSTCREFNKGFNQLELPLECNSPAAVDIAFVVDATGSMGDEMSYLNGELTDVINRAKEKLSNADLRTAAVFYRDSTDEYVTRHQDFSPSAENTVAYCSKQTHGGGGDHPEAVDAALETAVTQLNWRGEAVARLLFLVLDAPPHQDKAALARLRKMTAEAAAKGIRIVPVVCSGMTKDGEYLLRSIALATNGTYVFLTDDSGIGGSHLAPTTDAYEVEKLNDLMVRLITSFSETTACDAVVSRYDDDQVKAPKDALSFKAFPNPTPGPVRLKLPEADGEILVFDITGKLLQRLEVSERKSRLDLTGLAAGTYLVRYRLGEELGTQRVVLVGV
jgi:hypothetical protein